MNLSAGSIVWRGVVQRLFWLALLFSMNSVAQERLKVGLALSGGGSRGAAHIGVLRELERWRVPIDYIAGTSVGSIIGGLYASGMSIDEIEKVVVGSNLDEIFKDRQSREDMAIRRKFDHRIFQLDKNIGIKQGKVQFPTGLRQGQKLDLFLNKLLLSVTQTHNFDELPIPFRAVATDIETGSSVVLSRGNIATAIRASMSIPAVFGDVKMNGHTLVDGGISNNMPVDVVRAMGADVVIAVDIGSRLLEKDKLGSALGISLQLTNLLVRRTTQEQIRNLTEQDILITPDLGNFSATDFKDAGSIVPMGASAARKHAAQFSQLVLSVDDYQDLLLSRQLVERPPVVEFIDIRNDSRLADGYLRAKLHQKTGEPLDFAQLEKDISVIHGLGIFKNVNYDVIKKDGQTGLRLKAIQNPWGPNYLQFGLSYSSDLTENNNLALALGFTVLPTNERNGEWRTILRLGEELGVFSEYHQPLGANTPYYVNANIEITSRLFNIFEDSHKINTIRDHRVGATFSLGRELSTWGDVRAGYARYSSSVRIDSGPSNPALQDFQGGEWFAQFLADSWDDAFFPTRGTLGLIRWVGSRPQIGADAEFDTLLADISLVGSVANTTFSAGLKIGETFNGTAPLQSGFRLGGLFNLPGYENNELSGQNIFLLRTGVRRQMGRLLGASPYLGATLQYGNVFEERDTMSADEGIAAIATWLGWKTVLGPIFLGYGYAETGESSIYLELGGHF